MNIQGVEIELECISKAYVSSRWLYIQTDGEDYLFQFDGYDEASATLKQIVEEVR